MSRLPIRWRLTLVFALAMGIVLAAVGAFVYFRLESSLEEQLAERLETRAGALSALVLPGGEGLPEDGALAGSDEELAQVLGADGSVVAATLGFEAAALLGPEERARARQGPLVVEREVAGEPTRLLGRSAGPGDAGELVVVGAPLDDVQEALDRLLAQLAVAGPLALLLSSLAGYLLAGAALRPVDAMRRRASEISADTAGRRLPLPASHDEVSRLGVTLNAMLERLEAGLRRERRFVADASHELRTPLALLRTELELALRRPRTQAELERALRSASEEVDRLAGLAEDLLVLASAEEGRLPLRRTPLAADELLESVARRFAARAGRAGRALEVSTSGNGRISADRLRLEQALGNLVDNALRHGEGTIRLESAHDGRSLVLRVTDEGAGFPADFLPRAFERFSRADEARARGGAGLGLAIVSAIAAAHGGEVSAANLESGGAAVAVSIPEASSRAS